MSKAWATGKSAGETIPLILGAAAGAGDTFAVPSSVYIAENGRIYLGQEAILQHRDNVQRVRFDNLKRLLSEESVGSDLFAVPLDQSVDPTGSKLTRGDILVLYLAWLTELAETALARSIGKSAKQLGVDRYDLRATVRRFAIPCFSDAPAKGGDSGRAQWAGATMKEALLKAQIVADSIGSNWTSLSTASFAELMREIRDLDVTSLANLIATRPEIREPVAAGASRFEAAFEPVDEPVRAPIRRLLMIVDAGAGTTDFAIFQVVTPIGQVDPKYSLLRRTVRMSRIAGNEIDEILRPLVLRACGINPDNGQPRSKDDFDYICADLASQIRELKVNLFSRSTIDIELRPNASGRLDEKTLHESEKWRQRSRELEGIRDEILRDLFGPNQLLEIKRRQNGNALAYPVHVLLTGGSSALPMIRSLAYGTSLIEGVRFSFSLVSELPGWVRQLPVDIAQRVSEIYPQCAVAIGGSVPELPPELTDMYSAIAPAPKELPRFPKKISDS